MATILKLLYYIAKEVEVKMKDTANAVLKHKVENSSANTTDLLLYMDKSPNYCRQNLAAGSEGTAGRTCSVGAGDGRKGESYCNNLCLACGYNVKTRTRTKTMKCDCKFQYCCKVKCKACKREYQVKVCSKRRKRAGTVADGL